ncbi:MAG: BolA family transcriptional regulator [Paracoccaceae bacterium]|nr:MAG: BolA family transcriptional regulator [Alphaproteobacteria bacterium]GIX13119.1 MAG: BolA family transcriptional regulator [Paracoccaceae bacterium]
MTDAQRIRDKLIRAFQPAIIEVIDESERHRGHAGWREGGGTHFRVRMRAAALEGLDRIARQRAVHAVLREELAGPVHALALDLGGARDP